MSALYGIQVHGPQGQARRKLLYIDGKGDTVSGAFRREHDKDDKGDPYQFCCFWVPRNTIVALRGGPLQPCDSSLDPSTHLKGTPSHSGGPPNPLTLLRSENLS